MVAKRCPACGRESFTADRHSKLPCPYEDCGYPGPREALPIAPERDYAAEIFDFAANLNRIRAGR